MNIFFCHLDFFVLFCFVLFYFILFIFCCCYIRYFKLWQVEGRPPVLEYFAEKEDAKPKGNLILGPGTIAKHKTTKKSSFSMHVEVFAYDDDDGYVKVVRKKKSMRNKSMAGLPSDLYCYAGVTFSTTAPTACT